MKKVISVLLIFVMCFSFFACGKNVENEETSTEEYNIPTPVIKANISLPFTSADVLDPYASQSSLNRDVLTAVFEGLFEATVDGKGKKVLALSGEANGKTVTVKLQKGVKFSDGTELIGKDVKSSYEKAKNSSRYSSQLKNVADITVVDNYTLKFSLFNESAFALNVLTFPIVSGKAGEYVGTGKYKISYLDTEAYLEVNKNNRDYSEKLANQIALYDMAGVSSPLYPFKANKISFYKNELTQGEYTNLSSKTVSVPMNNMVFAGLNMNRKGSLLSVECVRQAINVGINRVNIAASSFLGQTGETVTPFRSEFYRLDGLELAENDGNIERAINILENGGFDKVTSDGIRSNGNASLRVTVLVCTDNPYKLNVAESLKTSLENIGFGVTLTERKAEDFVSALEDGYFDIYIGETVLSDGYDFSAFFSEKGAVNYGIDKEFFAQYDSYRKGETTVSQFIESFYTSVPFVPLFYRNAILSVNPNLENVEISGPVYKDVGSFVYN